MPRIKAFKRKYMLDDLTVYIQREMKAHKMKQKDLAVKLGCSQQRISKKLNDHDFDVSDLITIFTLFDTEPEEIAKLLKE